MSLVPTFVAGYFLFRSFLPALVLVIFTVFSAFMLSPDLDTSSNSYYRWGMLRFIWLPYRKLIPHRSRISHGFILGPSVRILYLMLISVLLVVFVSCFMEGISLKNILNTIYSFIVRHYVYFVAAILGIFWANIQHSFSDMVVSLYKHYLV